MAGSDRASERRRYVPALRIPALTRFYDVLLRTTLREEEFKTALIQQAGIQPGHRILDLGCGTATLTIMMKQLQPDALVVGLDGDEEALEIGRAKAKGAHVAIDFRRGLSFEPPFEPQSFDRVLSSLLLHHLTLDDKRRTLRAARSLLRPAGEVHIADWGEARSRVMRVAFLSIQVLDGFETTRDNVRGRILDLLRDADFQNVEETRRIPTVFGTLSFYRGNVPPSA